MKNRLSSSLLFVALALAVGSARADTETTTLKFSDPAKPGKLRVSIGHGDLRVHGADTQEIIVKSEAKAITSAPRKDGLRVLSAVSSFGLSEKDNVVVLDSGFNGWKGGGGDFDVTVPRGTSIIVPNAMGGDVHVTDVTGDVEIKSLNGEIRLENVSGGVQVETMNGEIRASFAQLPENKPLSFVSMNSEIIVRVPPDTKANVRLRTQNGTILTDFDDKSLVTKTESLPSTKSVRSRSRSSNDSDSDMKTAAREAARDAANAARDAAAVADRAVRAAAAEIRAGVSDDPRPMPAPMAPLPPMTGGKLVSGTLNGGGPEILLTAMNGDVVLRKLDGKK